MVLANRPFCKWADDFEEELALEGPRFQQYFGEESDGLGGGSDRVPLVSSPQSSTTTAPLKEGSQNHLVHEGG